MRSIFPFFFFFFFFFCSKYNGLRTALFTKLHLKISDPNCTDLCFDMFYKLLNTCGAV